VLEQADRYQVKAIYVGSQTFSTVSDSASSNYIFAVFSALKSLIVGTVAKHVARHASCKVIVVEQ
jgi:nucleotide-binding universal stress UspA family protein